MAERAELLRERGSMTDQPAVVRPRRLRLAALDQTRDGLFTRWRKALGGAVDVGADPQLDRHVRG